MVPKIDLSTIPKTVFWTAIAIFTIVTLSLAYTVISYKTIKPYQKHLEIECVYTNKTIVAIITAKTYIYNLSILDLNNNLGCYIEFISKDSMDACKFEYNKVGETAIIKIKYNIDNQTMSAVSSCKIIEKRNILDLLR